MPRIGPIGAGFGSGPGRDWEKSGRRRAEPKLEYAHIAQLLIKEPFRMMPERRPVRAVTFVAALSLAVVAPWALTPTLRSLSRTLVAPAVWAQAAPNASGKLLIAPVPTPLDVAGVTRLREAIEKRLGAENGVSVVVFRFEGASRDLGASQDLAAYIFDELRGRVTTIGWIPSATGAVGAAIGPLFACKDIVLGTEAVLAGLAVDPADDPTPEFDASFRKQIERHASHWLRPSLVTLALIDREHDDILRIVLRPESERKTRWEEANGGRKVDFLTSRDFQQLDATVRNLDIVGKPESIAPRGRALIVRASDLERWKLGSYPASTTLPELLNAIYDIAKISIDRQSGVFDLSGAQEGKQLTGFGQSLVDFFNHPIVRILLIMGGTIGILLEFKMFGAMIPGFVGLLCFILLFTTSLFPVTGSPEPTGTAFEATLFFIGLGLIAIEFFVLPGVAVFALAGGTLCLFSLVLVMVPPSVTPGVPQHLTIRGAITVLVWGFGIASLSIFVLLQYLPKSRFGRGFVNTASIGGVPTADSTIAAQITAASLVGRRGRAETTLRPAGKVLLDDGRTLDVVADGSFIERGETVIVSQASSMRIEVRLAQDEPDRTVGAQDSDPGPSTGRG
jgi:hypothetical protein